MSKDAFGTCIDNIVDAPIDEAKMNERNFSERPPTYWKDKFLIWKCLCLWPPKNLMKKPIMRKVDSIFIDHQIESQMTMRIFHQWNKRQRFEVLFENAAVSDLLIRILKREFPGWVIRPHRPIEQRMASGKRRKWRRHDGRFSVMSWNANCLNGKFLDAKRMLLKERPTIIALQETMRENRPWQRVDSNFSMGGHFGFETKVNANESKKGKRGLAMALDSRACLKMEEIKIDPEASPFFQFGLVSGFTTREKVIVANVYIPNGWKAEAFKLLDKCVADVMTKHPKCELIMVGDWNTRLKPLTRKCESVLLSTEMTVAKVKSRASRHVNGKPKSDIDHLLISKGVPCPKTSILRRWSLSDHWPLLSWWNTDGVHEIGKRPDRPLRIDPIKVNHNTRDIAFHNSFEELDKLEGEEIIKLFDEKVISVAKDLKVTSGGKRELDESCKTREEHFLENDLRRILRRISRLEKKQRAKPSRTRHHKICKLRKKFRRGLAKASKSANAHWARRYQESIANRDPADTFAWIKNAAGVNIGSSVRGPIKDENGDLVTDETKIAAVRAKHFSSLAIDWSGKSKSSKAWPHIIDDQLRAAANAIFTDPEFEPELGKSKVPREVDADASVEFRDWSKRVGERKVPTWEDEDPIDIKATELARRQRILNPISNEISESELEEYLQTIARRKSPGMDGVTNEFLRCALEKSEKVENDESDVEDSPRSPLFRCLHKLIKTAFNKAIVDEKWETAVVTPVPKKGDLTDLNNFRGIALMSNTMKIINGILAKRLMTRIMEYRLIDPAQVGFVNREEAVAQAKTLTEIIDRRRLKGERTILCFIDLAKAYDSVPHEGLLAKTERFGISGRALNWIRAIYKNPKIVCRNANGGFSDPENYDRGVRQGDPLSPVLFDIFMDDFQCRALHNLGVEIEIDPRYEGSGGKETLADLLYADDIVAMTDSFEKMRSICEMFSRWCDGSEMKANAAKCGVMVFPGVGDPIDVGSDELILIQGQAIPKVDTYTYLGIEINTELDRGAMVNRRAEAGKMAKLKYLRFLSSLTVPLAAKILCVKAIIQPTLSYGAEIWGFSKERVKRVESVLADVMRSCLRLPKSVSTFVLFQEFGMRRMYEVSCVAKVRLNYKMQILHSWLPKILSGRITKHVTLRRKRLWASVERGWIARSKVEVDLRNMKLAILELIRKEEAKKRPDFSVLGRLNKRLENLVHDGIRSLIAVKCAERPKSEMELRYVSDEGARPTKTFLRNISVEYTELTYGWSILMRFRMGRYWNAKRLAKAKMIPEKFETECPFCRIPEAETDGHILFRCMKWNEVRWSAFDSVMARLEGGQSGFDLDCVLFATALTGVKLDDTIRLPTGHHRRRMGLLLADENSEEEERDHQWNGEIAMAIARYLATVSPRRFSKMESMGLFVEVEPQP